MRTANTLLLSFVIPLFFGCTNCISSEVIFKDEKNLAVAIWSSANESLDSVKRDTISQGSQKFKNLMEWFDKNNCDWKSSIASYAIPDMSVTGNNFRMSIFKDGVVINFLDQANNHKQFTKTVSENQFDFLKMK